LRVQLGHDVEQFDLVEGEPLDVVIRGQRHRLTAGSPVRVQLGTFAPGDAEAAGAR
jgi:hypothetical protein